MDPKEMIDKLKGDLVDLNEQTRNIQAKADAENGRPLTEDEAKEMGRLMADFERTEGEIDRRSKMLAQTAALSQSFGPTAQRQTPEPQNAASGNTQSARAPRIEVHSNEDRGKWGFRSFGDFATSVRAACGRDGRALDPRLIANAPSTYSSEGVGEDGGYLVPPDFRQAIMVKVQGPESLLSRTDQLTTSGNSITFPADETTAWDSSGGIQAYWNSEGGAITQSKVALKEKQIRLNKLTCLVPVTEELLADAGALTGYLNMKVPQKFDYKIQNAIVAGSGVGLPQGIINAACTVSQAKDTTSSPNQAADTFVYRNVVDMWNRMYAPCRQRAVWLINPDLESQLDLMRFDTNRSSTQPVPVYLPAGGASATPYATLKGRPVIPVESCSAIGDVGDVVLADMSQYLTVIKSGGIRQDVSIHLFFDYDTSAFRFIFRVAGMPWWGSAITLPNSTSTRSCFVTLAAR